MVSPTYFTFLLHICNHFPSFRIIIKRSSPPNAFSLWINKIIINRKRLSYPLTPVLKDARVVEEISSFHWVRVLDSSSWYSWKALSSAVFPVPVAWSSFVVIANRFSATLPVCIRGSFSLLYSSWIIVFHIHRPWE